MPDADRKRGRRRSASGPSAERGGDIVVDVIDNGVGLPRENRQRLLEPYMTTREKGTGLGLAIVKKIIEDHGGRIELLDAPPRCSAWRPWRHDHPDHPARRGGRRRGGGQSPRSRKAK